MEQASETILERALAYQRDGQAERAHGLLVQVLTDDPEQHRACFALGVLERDAGRWQAALSRLERAAELSPNNCEYHATLGLLYGNLGSRDHAENSLLRALQLDPERAEIAYILGLIVRERGDLDAALACFERCADLTPDSIPIQMALGQALAERGQLERSVGHFQAVLALEPKSGDACFRLAEVLHRLRRSSSAHAMARRAVALDPERSAAHAVCGNLLLAERRFDEAIESYSRAVALDPNNAEVLDNLAHVYFRLGRIDEAVTTYRRAVAANPSDPAPHSALVYVGGFHPDWTREKILEEARGWRAAHADALRSDWREHPHDPAPHRRLRLGYVSPDFDNHCQRFFTLPLLRHHDHTAFEVVCYSSVKQDDEWTQKVRACADEWHDVRHMDDATLAEQIRRDRIDVLVDLTMHMPQGRLRAFAAKPAPVQICWLAYPGTTGLEAMDYRVTDPYLDPAPMDDGSGYAERPLHLPDAFWCYDPCTDRPEVNALPALARGYVTFGCLNDFCKIHRGVLELWARVLARVEGSRLLLLAPAGSARRSVLDVFARSGVAEQRIEFVDRLPHSEYLEAYHRIDVVLDCFPANGHTTSFDSLWMGVPVVTLIGHTVLGRAGSCQAQNLGLAELVAESPEQFVEVAVRLSGDLERLSQMRQSLRARIQGSPLMDAPRFARSFERACRQAWQDWCLTRAGTHDTSAAASGDGKPRRM